MSKTIFKTEKKEDFQSKIKKIRFNLFPAYRRSGGRVCFLSSDWKEIHIKIGLDWTTRNYVGSVFGGSIYAALDPIYMVQLINILGENYIVWDKSAQISFIKPVKKTVYARFLLSDDLLEEIKEKVRNDQKYIFDLKVCFEDENKTIYAEAIKTIYVADRKYYQQRKK
jgi:acyl-coenzyme A thioesterase PaaI-like protein